MSARVRNELVAKSAGDRWRDSTPMSDAELLRLLATASPIVRLVLEAEAKKRGLL